MSYNITSWITKELKDLRIPVSAFLELEAEKEENDDGSFTFRTGEATEMTGNIENGVMAVTEIDSYGEFSGHAQRDFLEPVLKASSGSLVAVRIWEGGDSIDKLSVENGVLTEEDYEI